MIACYSMCLTPYPSVTSETVANFLEHCSGRSFSLWTTSKFPCSHVFAVIKQRQRKGTILILSSVGAFIIPKLQGIYTSPKSFFHSTQSQITQSTCCPKPFQIFKIFKGMSHYKHQQVLILKILPFIIILFHFRVVWHLCNQLKCRSDVINIVTLFSYKVTYIYLLLSFCNNAVESHQFLLHLS